MPLTGSKSLLLSTGIDYETTIINNLVEVRKLVNVTIYRSLGNIKKNYTLTIKLK